MAQYPLKTRTKPVKGGEYGATPYPLTIRNPDGTVFGNKHHGIDDPCLVGTLVFAPEAMKIEYAGTAGTAGIMVKGTISNRQWRFLHLSKVEVRSGQSVKQGQLIGRSGNTGYSSGPHLHFDLAVNGKYVNPNTMIKESDMYKGKSAKQWHDLYQDAKRKMIWRGRVINNFRDGLNRIKAISANKLNKPGGK